MAGESLRSRLREALQRSAVKPSETSSVGAAGLPQLDGAAIPPAGDLAGRGLSPAEDVRYEYEEDPAARANAEQSAWIADLLGGAWQRDGNGTCLVVDRLFPSDRRHGNAEIGDYADALLQYQQALYDFDASMREEAEPDATLFSSIDSDRDAGRHGGRPLRSDDARCPDVRTSGLPAYQRQLLFFDLETTGLSGGAGTCAFLIGYGWFEGRNFRTRQYFLGGYGHEAAMLRMASSILEPNRTLGSFNGKTFDIPLIQGRYLFHRVASPFDDVEHLDLLHPARRLWRYRPRVTTVPRARDGHDGFGSYFRSSALRQQYRAVTGGAAARRIDLSDSAASCALGVLEEAILGYSRTGDVPGGEIPSRYFHYARTGDARPLAPVLEHNRLDLVSLAAVASIVARMLHEGAGATRNAHECLALGRLYERTGAPDRAADCFQRAVAGNGAAAWHGDAVVQREALRHLAIRYRRERKWNEAAAAWQQMLQLFAASEHARHDEAELEALVALAVHHEHRSRDVRAAHEFVLRALARPITPHDQESLRRRLARLERKLGDQQP